MHGAESLQIDGHSWIEGQERQATNDTLDPQEHQEFQSGAGICQYTTQQRFDIAFSTKEIMIAAAGPTTASETKQKRIARYFKGRQRRVLNFPGWESWMQTGLENQRQGAPRLKECWQSVRASLFDNVTQATVPLSSAESEARAITKACIEALYVKHLLEHQAGRPFKIEV